MNRREAVQYISLLLGGTILGGEAFVSCRHADSNNIAGFSASDVAFLDEVADTILPATSTPGAKEAKVGELIKVMVTDCYDEGDQKIFRNGMSTIADFSRKQYSTDFVELSSKQRLELLTKLDNEQKEAMKTYKQGEPRHYFRMMKELTLLGYFTSEAGCTKARRYIETPGKWEGCIPYKKGDKAWA